MDFYNKIERLRTDVKSWIGCSFNGHPMLSAMLGAIDAYDDEELIAFARSYGFFVEDY